MENNKIGNDTFFKNILKERVIEIKSIEDFYNAESCYNRGLTVTLDIPLEIVRKARIAEALKESETQSNHDTKFLHHLSKFSSKYIDINTNMQVALLRVSYVYVVKNYLELAKIQKVENDIKQSQNTKYEEKIEEQTPILSKNLDSKADQNDYIMTYDNKYLGKVEKKLATFETHSKEIWHYYTTISKEKESYKQAEKWGLFLIEIMDENLEYYRNFSDEQITEIMDENMRHLLSSRLTNIDNFEFQKVFQILKENWKHGYLLTIWQESKANKKVLVKKI